MNDKIKIAFEQAKYQQVLFNQRELLKAKTQTNLQIGYNGGMFKITPALIQFIKTFIESGYNKLPIIDDNNNPVLIEDTQEFLDEILGRYVEVVNDYYVEYEKIKSARTVEKLLNE